MEEIPGPSEERPLTVAPGTLGSGQHETQGWEAGHSTGASFRSEGWADLPVISYSPHPQLAQPSTGAEAPSSLYTISPLFTSLSGACPPASVK